MSIGSLGIVGSVAGAPLAGAKSAEVERNREAAAQQQQVRADEQADTAAGIGRTDGENHETHDRDADGRLAYQRQQPQEQQPDGQPSDESGETALDAPPQAVDPNGLSGTRLDLTG